MLVESRSGCNHKDINEEVKVMILNGSHVHNIWDVSKVVDQDELNLGILWLINLGLSPLRHHVEYISQKLLILFVYEERDNHYNKLLGEGQLLIL